MFRQTNASIPTTAVYQLNLILLTHRANMYDKRYVGGWYVQTFLRSWGTTLAFCLAVLVVGGWKISQAGRAVADENDLNQVAMWLCAKCVLVGLMRSYECVLGHGFDTDQILNNSYIHHDSICLRDLKSNDRALRKMDNKNTHTHIQNSLSLFFPWCNPTHRPTKKTDFECQLTKKETHQISNQKPGIRSQRCYLLAYPKEPSNNNISFNMLFLIVVESYKLTPRLWIQFAYYGCFLRLVGFPPISPPWKVDPFWK